ncbi:uncharacterized protein IL334_001524 [Kwoniella shivajii]|uniref:Oxidoreductase-like domain-containing protein n=1 Tax=Kwoniella shivajii TaxID=564305 RepID=A0ABZ1CTB3_9TREE|nr:hypothetical protein IL334_001524 [Kwoniella shivajii]
MPSPLRHIALNRNSLIRTRHGKARFIKRGISNQSPQSPSPPPSLSYKRQKELNLFARFERRAPRTTQLHDVLSSSSTTSKLPSASQPQSHPSANDELDKRVDKGDSFKSTSTTPTATSFQEIPSTNEGIQIVDTLPAMINVPTPIPNKTLGKEVEIQGIVVPPKPIPPGEEECCMSGCVNCVYTIYADDLEIYTSAVESARKALTKANVNEKDWPEQVRSPTSEEKSKENIEREVDPVMSAFLALENKLKKK